MGRAFALTYFLKRPELLVPILVRAQDYPVGVATLVGRKSLFVYGLDPAPHPAADPG